MLEGAPTGGQGGSADAAAAKGTALARSAAATTAALSPLQPALRTTDPSRPVKVLLVGDSLAGSLGVGLGREAAEHKIELVNEGIPACSVSLQGEIKVLFYTVPSGGPCGQSGSGSLFATWRQWFDQFYPDVVVYVGRGETYDQELDGQWQNLGEPSFDRYVTSRYRQAIRILGSRGATVVLLTTPYYDSGLQPSGAVARERAGSSADRQRDDLAPWPHRRRPASPSPWVRARRWGTRPGKRRRWEQRRWEQRRWEQRRLGTGSTSTTSTVSSRRGGQYAASEDGVNLRCGDGVHFSASGGMFVGAQLLPDLAALGQAHAAASPGGTWPGGLPPSTPSWYEKLPCP